MSQNGADVASDSDAARTLYLSGTLLRAVAPGGDARSQQRLGSAGLLPAARRAPLRDVLHDGRDGIRFCADPESAGGLSALPRLHGRAIHSVSCNDGIGGQPALSGSAGAPACSEPHGCTNESGPHSFRARTSCFDPELKTWLRTAARIQRGNGLSPFPG